MMKKMIIFTCIGALFFIVTPIVAIFFFDQIKQSNLFIGYIIWLTTTAFVMMGIGLIAIFTKIEDI